jgi:hypothetical protein
MLTVLHRRTAMAIKLASNGGTFVRCHPSMAAMEKVCARPPTPGAAWVRQIHATGGLGGFTTMVMVFFR